MKYLYLISQNVNNGLETYDSAVVCAESEEEARLTHPNFRKNWDGRPTSCDTWCNAQDVKVELVGIANDTAEIGVVCASFNAG